MRLLVPGAGRIKLLSPACRPEEEVICHKCFHEFDGEQRKRACFELCGHVSCLKCIMTLRKGCDKCPRSLWRQLMAMRSISSTSAAPLSQISWNRLKKGGGIKKKTKKKKKGKESTTAIMPQDLLLSSVLRKDSDENEFPQIESMSLSALPVLGCPTEAQNYSLEDDDDDGEEEEEEEEEEEIPLVDLADDEIPLIDLCSDNETEDNMEVFKIPIGVKSTLPLTLSEQIDNQEIVAPSSVETPTTQPASPMSTVTDCSLDQDPILAPGTNSNNNVTENCSGNECKSSNDLAEELDKMSLEEEKKEENNVPRTLRTRRKSQCYPGDQWAPVVFDFGHHLCKYCSCGFTDRKTLGAHLFQEHREIHKITLEKKKRGKNQRPSKKTKPKKSKKKSSSSKLKRSSSKKTKPKRNIIVIAEESEPEGLPQFQKLSCDWDKEDDASNDSLPIFERNPSPVSLFEQSQQMNTNVPPDVTFNTSSQDSDLPPKKRLNFRNRREMASSSTIQSTFQSKPPLQVISPEAVESTNSPNSRNKKKYTCCHCAKKFTKKMKLGAHLREHHGNLRPFRCDLCGWSFAQKNKLNLHRITHTIDRPHKCKYKNCPKTFNRKYSLERHIRIMHLKIPRRCEAAENKPCQWKKASCRYCNKIFENRKALQLHMKKMHAGLRPYECNKCEFSFAKKKHLVAHLKTHSDDRPHKCAMCDKSFNIKYSLERHLDDVHGVRIRLTPTETDVQKEEDKYCIECQSCYDSEKYLKVAYSKCGHFSCMDCVIKAELGCGQCTTDMAYLEEVPFPPRSKSGRFGGSPARLNKMMDKDGSEVEVKFETNNDEEISRTIVDGDFGDQVPFLTTSDDRSQVQVESPKLKTAKDQPKPEKSKIVKCAYCRKLFSYKRELGIHMQHLHSDKRPFPCETCQWPFTTQRDLDRHALIHTGEKPFQCQTCSAGFNRKSALNRHVKKIHLKSKRI